MPLDVKHQYVSTVPDNGDPTLVQGPHWNAGHNLQQGPAALLGRADSAPGQAPTLEVQLDATMAFVGGKLAAVIPAPPTSLPPSGTAGGALTGTYPNPTLVGGPLSDYLTTANAATTYAPISHTHTAAQITDFSEATDDRVAALLVAGTNVTLSYNDPANTLTINSTASGGGSATLPAGSVGYGAVGNTLTGVLADFSWDSTNKRLGVGIGAPAAAVDVVTQANTQAIKMSGYSLTGSNATGCFSIAAALNTTGQPDIFAINITDTSNAGGNAFVIRGGPSGTASLIRTTMSGDTRVAGWCQARLNDALVTNGADYFAYYLGNGSGGNIGMFAGLSNPTFSTFGRYGSIYLNGASPGLPYYNNNGTTGWDRLVGETSTQTLTNKSLTSPTITGTPSIAGYLPLAGGTLTGALTGTSATFSGTTTFTGSSATGGHVLYTDTNAGGQTWQTGPGAGSGSPDEWVVYNQGTAIRNLSLNKNGTVTLAGGLVGTVATFNAGASTPAMRVTGNDAVLLGLFNGATKGVRFTTDASQVKIEGVDNTGVGSFQPLTLGGSIVQVGAPLSGTTAVFSGTVSAPGAQIQMVFVETGTMASGSTLIPFDNTIPQITEGNEYMTLAITPKSATSKLIIEVTALIGHSVNNNMGVALFQDATANALAAAHNTILAGQNVMVSFRHIMTSGTTSATTFRVRIGGASAGTTAFNSNTGVQIYGGVAASSIVIREVV